MRRECYYHYHSVGYGVYLDNRYEINHNGRKQKSLRGIPRREGFFIWKAVKPDIHSSDSRYGSHGSQDDQPRGSWEASSGQSENESGQAQQTVNDNAASHV